MKKIIKRLYELQEMMNQFYFDGRISKIDYDNASRIVTLVRRYLKLFRFIG